ncbi:MAG: hypothetical protein ACKO01_02400 [Erythrobacter sp.]
MFDKTLYQSQHGPASRAEGAARRLAPPTGSPDDNGARPKDAPPRLAPKHRLKLAPTGELAQRKIVGVIAAIVAAFFIGCAVFAWTHERAFVPVPFGSTLLIELAVQLMPQLWVLAVVHNLMVASVAMAFVFAVSTAHVEIPGDPRQPHVVVWRRQSRFAYPKLLYATLLFGAGATLHYHGYTILAALLESPGFVFAVAALAHLFVPIARQYVTVEMDVLREGLGSHLTVGGGMRPMRVVFPEQLIGVERTTGPLEWCFGYAGIRVHYWVAPGVSASRVIHAFASAQAVESLVKFILANFPVSRRHKGLDYPAGFPLRPPSPPPAPPAKPR